MENKKMATMMDKAKNIGKSIVGGTAIGGVGKQLANRLWKRKKIMIPAAEKAKMGGMLKDMYKNIGKNKLLNK